MVFLAIIGSASLPFAMSTPAFGDFPLWTEPAVHTVVQGQSVSRNDIGGLMVGILSTKTQEETKLGKEMPRDAPFVAYVGKNAAGVAMIWASTVCSPSSDSTAQACNDAYTAALALAALESGKCGQLWQRIYERTPSERSARLALGNEIVGAFRSLSDQSAAYVDASTAWIQANIIVGMTRASAYDLLKPKGLLAFNSAYRKGKPFGNASGVGSGCDFFHGTGGEWPYQNEPLPKQEGGCAELPSATKSDFRNPDANLDLRGAFSLACATDTRVTISFGEDDRVTKVQVGEPEWTCL